MELSHFWEAASYAATQEFPQYCMEPEGSLPCSQEPSTGPYPEPDQSSPYHRHFHERTCLRYRTFHVPNLIFVFLSLGRLSKESIHVRRHLWHFVTKLFFTARSSNPKLEHNHLSAVRDRLFNIFAATFHILRSSLLPATCGRAMPWRKRTHLTWL
jgi:hypothetical protein